MELTRRDALTALAAAGVAAGSGGWVADRGLERRRDVSDDGEPTSLSDDEVDVLVAVAETVYPDGVAGVREFVETYSRGRVERTQDDAYRRGVIDASTVVDRRAHKWEEAQFAALDVEGRDDVLREAGADTADAAPDGTDAERIRHYLVNEVLFALYASPTGGELVGIENPQGHPGGLETYRRGPDR